MAGGYGAWLLAAAVAGVAVGVGAWIGWPARRLRAPIAAAAALAGAMLAALVMMALLVTRYGA